MSADWPLVKAGQKGPRVKALQRLLLHRGAAYDLTIAAARGHRPQNLDFARR